MRARVTRDGTIHAKNSTFGYFDATNPIPGKRPSYGLLPRLWLLVLMNILGLLELQAVAK